MPSHRARAAVPHAPSASPAYAVTGAKLGRAVLAYVTAIILVITLEPFRFRVPAAVRLTYWAPDSPWNGWFDVLTNVALFLPLGFVAALTYSAGTARRTPTSAGGVFAAAALLSGAIELAQCFEAGRYPSPTDVLANATGAWLGAWLHRRAARHLGAATPIVGRLALELPVMGLVYVTLPLLTLSALTAGVRVRLPSLLPGSDGGPLLVAPRELGLVALGACGGTLLGTVQRRQLGVAGTSTAVTTAGAAALWFAAGALPAAATAHLAYAAGVATTAVAAWLVGRPGVHGVRAIERRFEGEALGRAAPWLVAYLALVPLGTARGTAWNRLTILRDLEATVGFAVLGYALAEAWGRREWRYRYTAWRVALVAAGILVASAVIANDGVLFSAHARSALGAGAHVASASFGGWIYHLQRAHVRALLDARRRVRSSNVPLPARAA